MNIWGIPKIYIYNFYRQPLGQVAVVLPRLPPPVRSNWKSHWSRNSDRWSPALPTKRLWNLWPFCGRNRQDTYGTRVAMCGKKYRSFCRGIILRLNPGRDHWSVRHVGLQVSINSMWNIELFTAFFCWFYLTILWKTCLFKTRLWICGSWTEIQKERTRTSWNSAGCHIYPWNEIV